MSTLSDLVDALIAKANGTDTDNFLPEFEALMNALAAGQDAVAATFQLADTIADLKALSAAESAARPTCIVRGYSAAGDGAGPLPYRWNATSTAADNGGTVIAINDAPASGRWELLQSGPINVKWFGAVGDGATDDTAAIQAAINAADANGGGIVFLPEAEYGIGLSSEAFESASSMPYGILLHDSKVALVGSGKGTVLKRIDDSAYHVIDMEAVDGAQVRNLRIDGGAQELPVVGSQGVGIYVEARSDSDGTREPVLDTLWVENTGGYGIGVQWGDTYGMTMRNLFIDRTGADGIDIKRRVSPAFETRAIILDNIHVSNFGQGADFTSQAGVDIRGYVLASNIHVREFGDYARAGIRLRCGISTDSSLGAQRASLTNFYVERVSGGEATTYGVEVNASHCGAVNGSVAGCTIGVGHPVVGTATEVTDVEHTNVRAFSCTYGFRSESTAHRITYTACHAEGNTAGWLIEGDNNAIIAPTGKDNTGRHIQIQSTADGTVVVAPRYSGSPSSGDLTDAGTNTARFEKSRLAIGTSSPSAPIHFAADGTMPMIVESASAAESPSIQLRRSKGTQASREVVALNDVLGAIQFRGYDGTTSLLGAEIRAEVVGTPGTNDMPTRITFRVTADGASSPTDWLQVYSDGSLLHRQGQSIIVDPSSHLCLRSYTVATLPSAGSARRMIYVSDGATNQRLAVSDGTNWRFPNGDIVS